MTVSINQIAHSAYRVLMAKLRWLKERYRKDNRAGEFWSYARQKVAAKMWVKSQLYWFEPRVNVFSVSTELNRSRFAEHGNFAPEAYSPPLSVESYAPPMSPEAVMLAVEVA